MPEWIDITRPLSDELPVYSGHERFIKTRTNTVAEHGFELSHFSMGAHCGTHMDSPAHFIEGGARIDSAPIETLVGICQIIEITDQSLISDIPKDTGRLLLKTHDFKGLSRKMAQAIVDAGVKLLGIDRMSVAPSDDEEAVHRILLGNGIWILETLDLSKTDQGLYELVCLPLRVADAEGAPCRAVVRRIG